jgi:hypothetical protein
VAVRHAIRNIDFKLLAVLRTLHFVDQSGGNTCSRVFHMRRFSLTLNHGKCITLVSFGYTKTVDRSSYSERQRGQQCLCVNTPCTQTFSRLLFPKIVHGVFDKIRYIYVGLWDDDGGSTYLWNVGRQLFYTAAHPRRQLWKENLWLPQNIVHWI